MPSPRRFPLKSSREFCRRLLSNRRIIYASWVTEELKDGFRIKNTNVVMIYLEKGTKAHGPVTAKRLYIPLKPEAVQWSKGLKFAEDFVLAKRVRGIRALNILGSEIPIISDSVTAQFKILFAN